MGVLQQHPRNRQSQRLGYWKMSRKLVLVMVGLPARGKSYIVKMLVRYLSWIGEDREIQSKAVLLDACNIARHPAAVLTKLRHDETGNRREFGGSVTPSKYTKVYRTLCEVILLVQEASYGSCTIALRGGSGDG